MENTVNVEVIKSENGVTKCKVENKYRVFLGEIHEPNGVTCFETGSPVTCNKWFKDLVERQSNIVETKTDIEPEISDDILETETPVETEPVKIEPENVKIEINSEPVKVETPVEKKEKKTRQPISMGQNGEYTVNGITWDKIPTGEFTKAQFASLNGQPNHGPAYAQIQRLIKHGFVCFVRKEQRSSRGKMTYIYKNMKG